MGHIEYFKKEIKLLKPGAHKTMIVADHNRCFEQRNLADACVTENFALGSQKDHQEKTDLVYFFTKESKL